MTRTSPAPATVTARRPDDLLAARAGRPRLPALATRSSAHLRRADTFHARVDLPAPPRRRRSERGGRLLLGRRGPAPRARSVAFVVYADDARLPRGGVASTTLAAARASASRGAARPTRGGGGALAGRRRRRPGRPSTWESPVPRQAVVEGVVVHRSRADLSGAVRPAEAPRRSAGGSSAAVRRAACPPRPTSSLDPGRRPLAGRSATSRARPACCWCSSTQRAERRRLGRHQPGRDAPTTSDSGRDAVRRAPADLVAARGRRARVGAWLAGHGALAWCAVDRCCAQEPDHSLAALVTDALTLPSRRPPGAAGPVTGPSPPPGATPSVRRTRRTLGGGPGRRPARPHCGRGASRSATRRGA